MTSILLSTVDDALEHGYDLLADPDDLYHSSRWLQMEERVGIAKPFTVLSMPADDGSHATAATWGLIVEPDAFWPFMRADRALLAALEAMPLSLS
jgi:hypothetical protein